MNYKFIVVFFLQTLCFTKLLQAQTCTLYPITLEDRLVISSMIIEGKVVEKKSYWNDAHSQILTSYFIEVYKVFKGEQVPDTIAIVVQGGQVGLDILKVNPVITFNTSDYGIFMLADLTSDFLSSEMSASNPDVDFYRDCAWSQSFISIKEGKVHDLFYDYKSNKIENLYQRIYNHTGDSGYIEKKETPAEYLENTLVVQSKAITGFTPAIVTAATFGPLGVLTINGIGFGAARGTGVVRFPNADDGGATFVNVGTDVLSDYILWSDVQVLVRVPAGAGTGNFQLVTNGGTTFVSGTPLVISYNALDVIFDPGTGQERYEPDLVNDNGVAAGDYTLTFNNTFFTNAPAVASFRDALANWVFKTGVNFVDAGATTSVIAANAVDGTNIVTFNAGLPVGVLGVSFSSWNGCASGGTLHWFLNDVDLVFDPTPGAGTWYFGCNPLGIGGTQFDFESVTVHELGHHHQLGHIINPAGVMHFSIANGQVKRLIATNDEAGGDYVMSHSVINNPCGPAAMTMISGLAPGCAPLPIELVSFEATLNADNQVDLNWATESEINNDYFKIQRTINLVDYFDVTEIEGAGNSSVLQSYAYTDKEPIRGISYYRLQQVDFDGKFSYSELRTINLDKTGDDHITIIPNPASDFIYLQVKNNKAYDVKIYDAAGTLVLAKNNMSQDLIDIKHLSNGFYIIQIIAANGRIETGKFLISKL